MKYIVVVGALCLVACGPDMGAMGPSKSVGGGADMAGASADCPNPPKDSDGDGISDADEGANENPPRDTDHDGKPDYLDADSDNDGIPDQIEGGNPSLCVAPVDSDSDGKPDFEDLDSDSATDSTVPDAVEAGADPTHPVDTNGNGIADYRDPDNDGDGILDVVELTPQGATAPAVTLVTAPDTDGDGVPDFLDTDSDNDSILDRDEGIVDTDSDGLPNFRDLDSDGDCISDQIESGRTDPMKPPVDTDGDGVPDFEDLDSDNEGLLDQQEDANCNGVVDACETDRLKQDTDGDGVNDFVEYEDCHVKTPAEQNQLMCQCDGSNPSSSPLTHGDFVFVVDYMKPPSPTSETLNLTTNVSQADIVFAIDSTGSMQGSLNNLASNIASVIVPQVKTQVPDVAFGVLDFKDFNDSYDTSEPYVMKYDYRLETVSTAAGVQSVQTALNGLATAKTCSGSSGGACGGGDDPEAGWCALYAIAGGPPVTVSGAPGYSSTLPLASTPPTTPLAGETQGNVGGAGFRAGSVPIVVTVTDAEWHDQKGVATSGENGLNDYGVSPAANVAGTPSRAQAVAQLNALSAHVVALAGSGGGATGNPKARGLATASDTGALVTPADFGPVGTRPAGCAITQCCTGWDSTNNVVVGEAPNANGKCPLSFTYDDATGNGVSSSVVAGIAALANGLTFDIHVEASDVDPNTVDNFIDKLVPNLTGMGPATLCIVAPWPLVDNFSGPKALPGMDGVQDTFLGVGGGKQICFDVVPKENVTVMNTTQPQMFRAQLQVKGVQGANTVNLGTPRDVFFLVPPVVKNGPVN